MPAGQRLRLVTGRAIIPRLPVVVGVLAVAGCSGAHVGGAGAVPLSRPLRTQAGTVDMFPSPGSRTASPRTQITFRGGGSSTLTAVVVTGSRSGRHAGRIEKDSDGRGVSFLPTAPFAPGETVTVSSRLPVQGCAGGPCTFTVATPAKESTPPTSSPKANPPPPAVPTSYLSAPAVKAPQVAVTAQPGASVADVMLAPKGGGLPAALEVMSSTGEPIWYEPFPSGTSVNDLKVQTYRGQPVLTYWQGRQNHGHGYGTGVDVVLDDHYRKLMTVHAGNGYAADLHDFVLDGGSALLTAYAPVRWDLRPVGGPADGIVIDSIVQEVDLATGLVEFEWHSLDHIPLDASQVSHPDDTTTAWDYTHLNSVDPEPNGDLLISARHTSTLYQVDGATGDVLWTLGGRRSSFSLPKAAQFRFQHDARMQPDGTVTVFDDGGGPPRAEPASRALQLRLDPATHRAAAVRSDAHTPPVVANSQGDTQLLPGGGVFVGWGSAPDITEFDPAGVIVWDAKLPPGVSSYRAQTAPWTGVPTGPPHVVATIPAAGRASLAISWNGDTRTRAWRVTVRTSAGVETLTATRSGFETVVGLPRDAAPVRVQALDAASHVLATVQPR